MEYKVLIPSAGTGSRLGTLTKNVNKSLITIYDKPAISYIIEKFPKNVEIVIATGYKAELLKDFIRIAYPDRRIRLVDVDIYDGPGSGLGYTILKCEPYLQCPFIFYANDTLVLEDIPKPNHNWCGYDEVYNNTLYRSFKIIDNIIEDVNDVGSKLKAPAAIGLHGIYDYKKFWKAMNDGISYGSIYTGELYAIKHILDCSFEAIKFTWFDVGCVEGIEKSRKYFDTGDYNILPKDDESIWFIGDNVIKYSNDKDFIFERVERNKKFDGMIPKVIDYRENLYSYKFVKGSVLSKSVNLSVFTQLLNNLVTNFWKPYELSCDEYEVFKGKCLDFYKTKTLKRIQNYFVKYDYEDQEETINGIKVPKIMDLLDKIDWDNLSQGKSSIFHGDLHFENIILTEIDKFLLLDWRQNFGGILDYGDIYYDLAKLLHGIIVSHEIVNKDLYFIKDEDTTITSTIYRNQILVDIENAYYNFLKENNFDIKKVKILTALIYLNISPLHHYPYSKFLYFYGKYMLNNTLNE